MDVYFIRHGQSTSNVDGTHSGWAPIPLTEVGREQAARTHEMLKGTHFDKLFVSDVHRTQQTADIVFPGMPRTMTSFVREINNTAMRGKSRDEMYALYGELYLKCREDFSYAPLGIDCESVEHLHRRAGEFLKFLEGFSDMERIAVVSHAGFIMAVAANVLEMEKHPRQLVCGNASVSVFRFGKWGWQMRAWSVTPEIFGLSE